MNADPAHHPRGKAEVENTRSSTAATTSLTPPPPWFTTSIAPKRPRFRARGAPAGLLRVLPPAPAMLVPGSSASFHAEDN